VKDVREIELCILSAKSEDTRRLAHAIRRIADAQYLPSFEQVEQARDELRLALGVVFQR
jgi:hypothetical protein